ncbi:MAG: DUF5654 family protein [Polyangiaceae bacterium]
MSKPEASRLAHVRNLLRTMIGLATGSLGFVAALAWNDAIKALITKLLGPDDSLSGLFIYAVSATVLAVGVLLFLGRLANKIGGEASIEREVD